MEHGGAGGKEKLAKTQQELKLELETLRRERDELLWPELVIERCTKHVSWLVWQACSAV